MNPADLQQIQVFADLEPADLAALAAGMVCQDFAPGEVIAAEGDPFDGMYFIAHGEIHVRRKTGPQPDAVKLFAIAVAGEHLGEAGLFERTPRPASLVAVSPTRVFWLPRAAFEALPKEGGRVGMTIVLRMLKVASERLRRFGLQLVAYDQVGKAIGESKSLAELLGVIARQLGAATQADWTLVVLRDQFHGYVDIQHVWNRELDRVDRERLTASTGFLSRACADPQGHLASDLSRDCPFVGTERPGLETGSALVAPILADGQPFGALVAAATAPGRFDANDLNLARGIATQAAQAILNARHQEEEIARTRHARRFVPFNA